MVTWGNYQSVIQLAAALNFGYAALELFYQSSFSPILTSYKNSLKRVKDALDGGAVVNESAGKFQRLKSRYKKVSGFDEILRRLSPWWPITSAFLSSGLLIYSSEFSSCPMEAYEKVAVVAIGYGWMLIVTALSFYAYVLSLKK